MVHANFIDPPKTYTQDGVCLTETGMSQLQSLNAVVPRRKRAKPKLKLKIINQNSVAVLQTPPDVQSEHSRDGEMDDSRGNYYMLSSILLNYLLVGIMMHCGRGRNSYNKSKAQSRRNL